MRHHLTHARSRNTLHLSLALVLLLAAGCGSGESGPASGGQRIPSPEEATTADLPASPAPGVLECGAALEPRTGGALTVTGRFPGAVSGAEQVVTGTVSLAARRGGARGVVTPQAEAFLVREGHIVTLPVPQDSVGRRLDLAHGSVEPMPATVALVPCSGGDRLARGTYDLYVRVVLNHDDGSRADALGGPWPLEVR